MGIPLGTRPTVLMADPLEDSHDFYVSWFAGEGFDVIGTGRGDIALAMIDESAPDLLVIDFGLTGVDTPQVISRLRRSAATARLPIVLLTRHDDAASLESVRSLDVAILPTLGDTREMHETLQQLLSATASRIPHRSGAPLTDRLCDDEWLARFRES
jgi:DNA-binding response OmpR family regulator